MSRIIPAVSRKNNLCNAGNKRVGSTVYASEVPDQRLPDGTFADLALPLFDQLYNFAHWLTQDASEAEDLVQESYVKALRGFPGFQAGTNFRAWIFRILRNTFLTSRTGLKLQSGRKTELDRSLLTILRRRQFLISKTDRTPCGRPFRNCRWRFREILLLCEVEEMSYEEIAQVLAIPIGTVMSRLHRARKALRARLTERVKEGSHGM